MERAILEQHLALAEDHIDAAQQRVERQRLLVQQMKGEGKDVRIAEELLARFERSLETFCGDRDLLLRLLKRAN